MSSGTQCASGRSDSLRNVDGNIIFDVGDYGIYNNSGVWTKSDTTDSVPSVAGLTGPIGSAALTDALTDGATNHVFTAADFTKLGGIEANADVTDAANVSSVIHAATSKTTPADDDELPLIDSAASFGLKKWTIANLKAWLAALAITLANKTLTNPTITNYTESVVAIGTITTTHTLDITNGTVQTATLTASTACIFTMPAAGAGKSFLIVSEAGGGHGHRTDNLAYLNPAM